MAETNADAVWTEPHIESLAPDDASIPAARKVLTKGGFGTVEPTVDGRGWWVVCRGLTDTYQVSVQRNGDAFDCRCNCPSPKIPCKHALALLLHLVAHPELRAEADAPKTAATDFEALLRAVFANPDDDTARLVFADYLEENDQPDRAALIRLQCEQTRLNPRAKRYRELTKLIKPVDIRLREQIGAIPDGLRYEFRRGFMRFGVDYFVVFDSFPARLADLFRGGWVESLVPLMVYDSSAEMLLLAAQIGELDVSSYARTDDSLLALAAATADARATGRLARVLVHTSNRAAFDRMLRAERGEALDPSADPEPVRHYNFLNPRTFAALLQFGRLTGARDLYLNSSSDPLGAKEAAALVTADLSALRHLRLNGWKITKGALETLVNSPALAKLTTLGLHACRVQAPAVNALVRSPLFATLKTIDLASNNIGEAGVAALLKAGAPPALKKLVLSGGWLTAADKRRLRTKFGEKVKL